MSGQEIGRYVLRERLGEGGCGVVYAAEERAPDRRRVAVKVIKYKRDACAVAQFDFERQALRTLHHPNICGFLDSGWTGSGHPYVVMELISGPRITHCCEQSDLNIGERLELFAMVCEAVHFAHTRGIIHRDLKPSNILVTRQRGCLTPKLIDFGIAKKAEDETDKGQFVGTPGYMSPEQGQGRGVRKQSDIFGLGTILHELLTGLPPGKHGRKVPLGLRSIVARCLAKNPSRRYASARSLAASVRRHLPRKSSKVARAVRKDTRRGRVCNRRCR